MTKKIIEDEKPFFEFKLLGITIEELAIYCTYARINLDSLKTSNQEYYIPGHYLIGLFRYMVPELKKEYPSFPMEKLDSFSISANGTLENRLLIDQSVTIKMQLKPSNPNKQQVWIEFVRDSNNEIILAGLFGFKQEPK